MAKFRTSLTENHVVIVNPDAIYSNPDGSKKWVPGKSAKFKNYHLDTDDKEIIEFLQNPANGGGCDFVRLDADEGKSKSAK